MSKPKDLREKIHEAWFNEGARAWGPRRLEKMTCRELIDALKSAQRMHHKAQMTVSEEIITTVDVMLDAGLTRSANRLAHTRVWLEERASEVAHLEMELDKRAQDGECDAKCGPTPAAQTPAIQ